MIPWLIGSIICSILYRVGGSDLPLENKTKYRDAGCPLIACGLLAYSQWPLTFIAWIGLILSFGLSWGAMTTYFKKKGTDAMWWNWLIVGLAFGVAFLPYAWATQQWIPFAIRAVATTILIMVWSQAIGWAVLEELGRGFIYCSTLLIFNLKF